MTGGMCLRDSVGEDRLLISTYLNAGLWMTIEQTTKTSRLISETQILGEVENKFT